MSTNELSGPVAGGPHPTTYDLLQYIEASPTPQHCVAETRARLESAGFSALDESEPWSIAPGDRRFAVLGGSIVAFRAGTHPAAEAGFRLLGAHTDSPNLRIKPQPDVHRHGYHQLGVETYGGLLTYTWLDRDLGLAGTVAVREGDVIRERLIRIDRAMLLIPSLAIHLNRTVRKDGLKLNDQKHLPPILAVSPADSGGLAPTTRSLATMLASTLSVDTDDVLAWELSLFDLNPPRVAGLSDELISAPRLDNQAMCHASLMALLRADASRATQVVCLYDHEEVGSQSAEGAGGDLVHRILRRLATGPSTSNETEAIARAAASSRQISADMAHALHPNYADRHEPEHKPALNGGPVIKINRNQRYATSARTEAQFEAICQELGVPYQKFVNRTDLACGSTIGPISAANLGIETVDVGNPMLGMHSIRETGGAHDPERMVAAMKLFLER